jgi:hypothetical protein
LTAQKWTIIGELLSTEALGHDRYKAFGDPSMICFYTTCDLSAAEMHERHDKWDSAYVPFHRWAEQGV